MNEKRRRYGPNNLMSTDRVRQHLRLLQQYGMGHKTVARHTGVGSTAGSSTIPSIMPKMPSSGRHHGPTGGLATAQKAVYGKQVQ